MKEKIWTLIDQDANNQHPQQTILVVTQLWLFLSIQLILLNWKNHLVFAFQLSFQNKLRKINPSKWLKPQGQRPNFNINTWGNCYRNLFYYILHFADVRNQTNVHNHKDDVLFLLQKFFFIIDQMSSCNISRAGKNALEMK